MIRRPDGHVSLLVDFRPSQARSAAAGLAHYRDRVDLVVTLDARGNHLAVDHVRGADLQDLTAWLYQRGARRVFVRYPHEGALPLIPSPAWHASSPN